MYIGKFLPTFWECNSAAQGIVNAFARIAQKRGAVALVVPPSEKVSSSL